MSRLYRKIEGSVLEVQSLDVLHWGVPTDEAVQFWCPCGERLVYVTSSPHKITFREDGVLESLGGSCGYKANPKKGRPENWCHFTIKNGVAKMHGDSGCPGAAGAN